MFDVLANRTYRRLLSAQVLSLTGTGLTTVALGLLAYDLAGADAGAVLGTALALKMIAYVGIAPFAAIIAARWPRRRFLVALDLCRAGLVGLLPFVTEIWQIYVLVFVFQAFSAGFTPTFQATIPSILPDEGDYTKALSLSRLAYDLESLFSPLLAALLLTVMNFHWLFAGTAIGFLASAALVVGARLPKMAARAEPAGFRKEALVGLRIYLATPRLRALLALSFAVAAASAMVIVNTVVFVRASLDGTDEQVAIFFACYGLGSMAVALMLPKLLDRFAPRPFMLAGAVVLALGLAGAALGPGYGSALALWALLGLGGSLVQTPAGLLLRRSAHEADRPALFSAQFALSHACWLVTYPLAGWLGAWVGLEATSVVMAACALLGLGVAATLWGSEAGLELVHSHPEFSHEHLHVHDAHHQHAHEGWEGPEPHRHPHHHSAQRHAHAFVIDDHHPRWPSD